MSRITGILICLTASLYAEQASYTLLARETIERRLGSVITGNGKRFFALERLFHEAGCAENLVREQVAKEPPNLVCSLAGDTENAIVIGGHFDHVNRGDGIVDNWSGASLLPSLYQSLKSSTRKHTFVFVGFTAEEKGLIGSTHHVKMLEKAQLARIRAMVNLDTLGLGPTKADLETADKSIAGLLAAVARNLDSPLDWVNFGKIGSSDFVPFRAKRIPTISIHSVTQKTFPILHSASDRMDAVNVDSYYESYRLITAFLAVLDQRADQLDTSKAKGR